MFWKVIGTLGAGSLILGGCDIMSTTGCVSVNFGGTARRSTYSCTFGQYPGEMSSGSASTLMILGGSALLGLLWLPMILRNRRNK